MINVLAIGLDYLMLQKMKFRGDVVERQFEYARHLKGMHHVIYSPRHLGFTRMKWGENIHIYPTSSSSKPLFFFDALRTCGEIIAKEKIDVITAEDPFVTGLVGYILKRRFAIPLNVQVHVDFCDNAHWINNEIENHLFNRLGKWVLKRADTIRVGTSYEKDKFVNLGIDAERIRVIPVYCDLSKFAQGDGSSIRKRLLGDKYKYLFFSAARITSQKDLPTMVRAMEIVVQKHPDVLLVIAGDGVEKNRVEEFIAAKKLDNNIKMIGAVDHNEIPDYYAACDIYLLSSIFEGTCIALVEAAAAEKCIVSSRFAGTYDLIEDGKTGSLFEIGGCDAMAQKIVYLLEHMELAAEMGKAGKQKVAKHFSYDNNISGLVHLWENTAQYGHPDSAVV